MAIFWVAFVTGIALLRSILKSPSDEWMFDATNNPDKFYLWGSTTNFHFAFTYDRHAADGWLFEWGNAPPRPLLLGR